MLISFYWDSLIFLIVVCLDKCEIMSKLGSYCTQLFSTPAQQSRLGYIQVRGEAPRTMLWRWERERVPKKFQMITDATCVHEGVDWLGR
jgi:hypothetical protein